VNPGGAALADRPADRVHYASVRAVSRSTLSAYPALVFLVLALAACSRSGTAPAAAPDALSAATAVPKPDFRITPADGPRWFELTGDGLAAIAGPADASLAPFEPWPLARRAVGFLGSDGFIAAAVNRDGFLVCLVGADGSAGLYRRADPARFDAYSIGGFFLRGGWPTAVLYRDRFFVDPSSAAAAPAALGLAPGGETLQAVEIPALASFPATDGWDIEAVSRAADGSWIIKASTVELGVSYRRAADLGEAATPIATAAYRAGRTPSPVSAAEAELGRALAAAAAAAGDLVALAAGMGEAAAQAYEARPAAAAAADEPGQAWAWSDGLGAYVVLPDGRLFVALKGDGRVRTGRLPDLPGGFAYTGIGASGALLVASWEEQTGSSVGAAGVVVLYFDYAQGVAARP
jgi:hypothetical protein